MSEPVIIASLEKNRTERLRVALDEFRGRQLLDLRVTVELSSSSGIQTPTKKGVSIGVHLLPELRRSLAEAEEEARKLGWLSE